MDFPLVKELRQFIGMVVVLAAAIHLYVGVFWAIPCYLLLGILVFIARQWPRNIQASPLIVLAPVDGKVLSIERGHQHSYLDGAAVRIRIQQHNLGEFVLHSPIEGRVIERWWPDKSDSGATNFGFVIQADEGDRCVVDIVNAERPRFKTQFIPSGYRTRQGQRCGIVGIGVLADVYIAEGSRVKVAQGDKVRAGSVVIAKFRQHK